MIVFDFSIWHGFSGKRTMTVMIEMLTESPLTPSSTLGPYRAADYMGLPDEPRCELIYGRLYVSPSPVPIHQVVVFELGLIVRSLAGQSGGLSFVAPLDVKLADHSVVQPDVIYVSPERRGIVQERIDGAPDLLIEVLSPSTSRRDRGEKLQLYAASGVSEFWLVDPVARHIEFLIRRPQVELGAVAEEGRFAVEVPRDGVYRSGAIDGLEVDLAAFWSAVEEPIG